MAKLVTESRTKSSGVLYAVINTSTLDALPVLGTDNGNGTSTLKVDTELTATIDPSGLATHTGQDEILAKQPALEGTDKAKVSLYVKKSANADTVLTLGNTNDANSLPVTLSTETLSALETISLNTLPDTSSSDLSHIHSNLDTVVGAISSGHIQTDIVGELPAGNQLIGKTGIDQTTDGTTNRVVAKISQTAGENHVEICDSSGNGITSTTNALDINIKSGNPTSIGISGSLPDTIDTDLAHIHSNSDSIKTSVETIDNCISGNEAQVDVVTLPVSFNAGANDATTQRVVLSNENISNLAKVKDNGPSWTPVSQTSYSADASSTALDITTVPTSGQKIVISDLYIWSTTTACVVSIYEESNETAVITFPIATNACMQFVPRSCIRNSNADKKFQIKTSVAAPIYVWCSWYNEA